jgi:probable F420-dependent oxidoreductase
MRGEQLGVWTTYKQIGEEHAAEAAALVEELGLGSFWLGGSPRLSSTRPLLEATERIAVGTSIVNIWAYEPAVLATEWEELRREFPDRAITVGLGVGHQEMVTTYAKPLTAMREFLDGLDAATPALGAEHRAIAALGPKMLDLARERTRGSLPYLSAPAHTASARERLGPGPLLAPEMSCVVADDPVRARELAREHAAAYVALRNYADNALRSGFEESDLADGGSERLVAALVPHGNAEAVLAGAQRHLDAGADQVALQAVGETGIPARSWRAIAAAL